MIDQKYVIKKVNLMRTCTALILTVALTSFVTLLVHPSITFAQSGPIGIDEEVPIKDSGAEEAARKYREDLERYNESRESNSPSASPSTQPTGTTDGKNDINTTNSTGTKKSPNMMFWLIGGVLVFVALLVGALLWSVKKRKS